MIQFKNENNSNMKGHRISILVVATLLTMFATTSYSQFSSRSGVGVLEGSSMSFFNNHHFDYGGIFASPGVITGSRTVGKCGLTYFNNGSSWTNADELQYIDGYVVNATGQSFTFPIGHNANYKPLALTGSTSATTAAYWNRDVASVTGTNTNTAIAAISSVDYWEASGSDAAILTLSWDAASNIAGLTGSTMANLSIVGWNGSSWDVIPSKVDDEKLDIYTYQRNFSADSASKFVAGSISTTGEINLDNYEYFTLASLTLPFTQLIAANNGFGSKDIDMFLYPNPASSFENLTVVYHINEFESADLVIYNMQGQVLYSHSLTDSMGVNSIDNFPNIKSGTYLVSIQTSKGEKQTMKLVLAN